VNLYKDKKKLNDIRKSAMAIDHSWENVCQQYIELYNLILNKK
jgi:starch synthase